MKPKLLYCPLDFKLRPYADWFNAFSKHYDCRYYTTLDDACLFDPNVVVVHSGALPLNELKALRVNLAFSFLIQWTGDAREELLEPVMRGKDIFDATFLAAGIGQKKMYENALGHPVHYLQHAVSSEVKYSVQKNFLDKKITFIGNNYDQFEGARERNELCAMLSKEFPEQFEVYGSGWDSDKYNNKHPLPHTQKLDVYNRSFISLSANILNDIEGYWSDRPLEIMAAGSCCLMRYVPKLEKHFINGLDCIFYRNNEEAISMVRMLLENERLRNKTAQQGQDTVMQRHTYDNRVQEIINAIK